MVLGGETRIDVVEESVNASMIKEHQKGQTEIHVFCPLLFLHDQLFPALHWVVCHAIMLKMT